MKYRIENGPEAIDLATALIDGEDGERNDVAFQLRNQKWVAYQRFWVNAIIRGEGGVWHLEGTRMGEAGQAYVASYDTRRKTGTLEEVEASPSTQATFP
jgi:hypothetical protein